MSHTAVYPAHSGNFTKSPGRIWDEADNGSKTTNTLNLPEPNYYNLEDRLKTFEHWPNTQVSKHNLAEAGFIFTGEDDIVICPFCKIEGYQWVSGDNPMEDHRSWRPNCPFVNEATEHDNSSTQHNDLTIDTCGPYGVEIFPNSVPEDTRIDLNKLGIQKSKGAIHDDKITYQSRLDTFENWPKSMKQRPADLAEAGFFYTGVGDKTVCFYCGVGLKDWEEGDKPWEQHAIWFSKCVYLNLKKGKEYIERVKREKEDLFSLPSTSGVETKEEPATAASVSEGQCENNDKKETEVAEKTLCKICYKNELGVVFLPCGHICACVDCATALKNCAVCRKPLEATVRAFLS